MRVSTFHLSNKGSRTENCQQKFGTAYLAITEGAHSKLHRFHLHKVTQNCYQILRIYSRNQQFCNPCAVRSSVSCHQEDWRVKRVRPLLPRKILGASVYRLNCAAEGNQTHHALLERVCFQSTTSNMSSTTHRSITVHREQKRPFDNPRFAMQNSAENASAKIRKICIHVHSIDELSLFHLLSKKKNN